jgi:hypothetical protein
MLVDVSASSTQTTVLGTPVSMPLLIAPTAFQRMAHPDGEPATARAAAAADTIMTLSTAATADPAEVNEAAPGAPRWFQLYWFKDEGVTRALVDQAVAADFRAIVLTIDAPGSAGRRERDLGPFLPLLPASGDFVGDFAGQRLGTLDGLLLGHPRRGRLRPALHFLGRGLHPLSSLRGGFFDFRHCHPPGEYHNGRLSDASAWPTSQAQRRSMS